MFPNRVEEKCNIAELNRNVCWSKCNLKLGVPAPLAMLVAPSLQLQAQAAEARNRMQAVGRLTGYGLGTLWRGSTVQSLSLLQSSSNRFMDLGYAIFAGFLL